MKILIVAAALLLSTAGMAAGGETAGAQIVFYVH